MKCHKCKFDNIIKASYCNRCGEKFTEKERENAYNKTIYGKIKKIEKLKDILSLDIITGSIVYKVLSILIVLGIGIYFLFTMGLNTKILNSKDYDIYYNKTNSQYYLIIDDEYDTINVSLYRPNRVKKMTVSRYNVSDKLISADNIKKDDKVILNVSKDDYYIIESKYSNKKKSTINVVVYHKNDIKK